MFSCTPKIVSGFSVFSKSGRTVFQRTLWTSGRRSAAEADEKHQKKKVSNNVDTRNFYEILGVTTDATSTEIREAFYRKVKELHPDINPNAEAKAEFQLVQEAFRVLKDLDARKLYNDSHEVEKRQYEKAKDMETYWMHRRAYGAKKVWSEKLVYDMIRASSLRAQRRKQRKPGQPPVKSLSEMMKEMEQPVDKKWLPYRKVDMSDAKHILGKASALCVLWVGLGGTYFYFK